MKQSEITIGQTYVAKVSGKLAPVRIENCNTTPGHYGRNSDRRSPSRTRFTGTNLATGRAVHNISAARLRRQLTDAELAKCRVHRPNIPFTYAELGNIVLASAGAAACQSGYGTVDPEMVGRAAREYNDINPDGTLN